MVQLLLKRYPQYTFYCDDYNFDQSFCAFPNMVSRETFYEKYGRLNHIVSLATFNRKKTAVFDVIFNNIEKRICSSMYIGGSLFMEGYVDAEHEIQMIEHTPFFIIGANFGPYTSNAYRDSFEEYFNKCAGVTFRDKKSYDLYKHLPNVKYAPDVVFTLDTGSLNMEKHSNRVLISILDVSRKKGIEMHAEQYEQLIAQCCVTAVKRGKIPVLMSFCKQEGDEVVIDRIQNRLPDEIRKKLETFFYRGNMNEALEQFRLADEVIATRFHAMVLALKFRKPFFVISYNAKIDNVLCDLGIQNYVDIKSVSSIKAEELFSNISGPYDISAYMAEAEKQYEQFDRYMNYEEQ